MFLYIYRDVDPSGLINPSMLYLSGMEHNCLSTEVLTIVLPSKHREVGQITVIGSLFHVIKI